MTDKKPKDTEAEKKLREALKKGTENIPTSNNALAKILKRVGGNKRQN